MKQILFVLSGLLLLFSCKNNSEEKTVKPEYPVTITLKDFPNQMIYLADFYGDKNKVIDSAKTDNKGKAGFRFITKDRYCGMYRLVFAGESFVDFIFDYESIDLSTTIFNPTDSMQVINSVENKIYFDFIRNDHKAQKKLELLVPLIDNYPEDDPFFMQVEREFTRLQKERNTSIDKIVKENPHTCLAKIMGVQKKPFVSSKLNEVERNKFLKEHFFDDMDFTDTALIHSNVFTSKSISYLTLYTNKNLSRSQQEDEFIVAVDVILSKAKPCKKIFELVMDYLMRGFEEFHYNKVLRHIAEKYSPENTCENTSRKSILLKRLKSYQQLVPGKKAPDIFCHDLKGKAVTLSAIKSDYTLVLFWATWCPHCQSLLPELNKLFLQNKNKTLEVLAISVDTSITAWTTYLKKENFSWINCCDRKGWEGKAANDYCIYATPAMFLLDKKKYILDKPISVDDLFQALKK
jgi:thiol-disulfide isomerase/thioredoxin